MLNGRSVHGGRRCPWEGPLARRLAFLSALLGCLLCGSSCKVRFVCSLQLLLISEEPQTLTLISLPFGSFFSQAPLFLFLDLLCQLRTIVIKGCCLRPCFWGGDLFCSFVNHFGFASLGLVRTACALATSYGRRWMAGFLLTFDQFLCLESFFQFLLIELHSSSLLFLLTQTPIDFFFFSLFLRSGR